MVIVKKKYKKQEFYEDKTSTFINIRESTKQELQRSSGLYENGYEKEKNKMFLFISIYENMKK